MEPQTQSAVRRTRLQRILPAEVVADLSWAPTISLSWLWGLGFFFSFHMVLTYGWLGFAMFAAPNAFGLFAFGWILGDPRRDAADVFAQVQSRFMGLFLWSQILAVAITMFAVVAYLLIPLFGVRSVAVLAIVVVLAMAVGHASTVKGLKSLHAGYLAVGVAAALTLLALLARNRAFASVPVARFDARFYSLVVPSLVGFLLGPWTDVQHWQRVIAIRSSGGSARRAYSAGAFLFLGLICLNALIAAAAGPALVTVSSDGLPGLQAAVAGAVARQGFAAAATAYCVWAGIATASTLDSFYVATRWLLMTVADRSTSPLMAFIPQGVVTSPIWYLVTAALVAWAALVGNVAMIFLMIAYATLFVGATTCLVCEVITGRKTYDGTLCALIGFASFLTFTAGYLSNVPELVAIAPVVGLVGAFAALKDLMAPPARTTDFMVSGDSKATLNSARDFVKMDQPVSSAPISNLVQGPDAMPARAHGFEGQWYVLHLTPTYDDTNSTGNIYFANYFRWIGKARELMFNDCMPDFDIKTTAFYILTKSFTHEFRREIGEFEPVSVRLRIMTVNRKFVTIVHEIHCAAGAVGRGEQTLMFVDAVSHKALDIPASVLQSFLPYYEKVSRPIQRVAS